MNIVNHVIQMINRGCCRKIVDGKALKMKVSMLLPKSNGALSGAILQSIRNEMILSSPWGGPVDPNPPDPKHPPPSRAFLLQELV